MDGEGESSEGRAGADARRSHTAHTRACALQLEEPREIRRGDARPRAPAKPPKPAERQGPAARAARDATDEFHVGLTGGPADARQSTVWESRILGGSKGVRSRTKT